MSEIKKTPYFVYEFENSYVEMGYSQFWQGYCILFSKVNYNHLSDMPIDIREAYLMEMSILGDAMMKVLQPRRINYNILGNSHPVVHAHLFPRYEWEEEPLKQTVVWRYPDDTFAKEQFNSEKHGTIQKQLAQTIDELYQMYLHGKEK